MREDYQKVLKKLISFLLSNLVPFNELSYLKQKGSGTSEQWLLMLQNKLKKILLLVIFYLTKFLSYSKNHICKFMETNSWYHKLFHFYLSFWVSKVWKGRDTIQKFEYLENEKSFLHEIKNIFHRLWRLSFGEKIKIW